MRRHAYTVIAVAPQTLPVALVTQMGESAVHPRLVSGWQSSTSVRKVVRKSEKQGTIIARGKIYLKVKQGATIVQGYVVCVR
jgi:hypothetical protein